LNMPWESLSYILADAGYDVWMGNQRGNTYGKAHVNISVDSREFWEFSWDQMAEFDFPAMIDYVRNNTGYDKISYIGHSEGTLVCFAALSEHPEWASKINIFIGFGPLITVGHITNVLFRFLADTYFDKIVGEFDHKQFLPSSTYLEELFPLLCAPFPQICEDVIEFICGPHRGAFNLSRMQVMSAHEPGGTSIQNMEHFTQAIRKDNFAKYDYNDPIKNSQHYGQRIPPSYNISNFPTSDILPVALYSGSHDELADPADVKFLISQLPSPPILAVELQNYAHLDFVWDIEAYQQFYPEVLSLIQNASASSVRQLKY